MTTVSDLITKKPLLPVIEIDKNGGGVYTYNPFIPTFDFRVISLQLEPPYSNVSGSFTLKLTSSDATNSASNTLISNIDEGNEINIWIGKDNASKKHVFCGIIDTWLIKEDNVNFMHLTTKGPDFGSDILHNRIVTYQWAQELDSNGDPVDTDTTTTIQRIVMDMLAEEKTYPTGDLTAEDQGIVVDADNIIGSDIKLKAFSTNYELLDDKLQNLDDINGTIHYVTPDKVFHMNYPLTATAESSGIFFTDDNTDSEAIAYTPTSKLGLIAPGAELKRTLEDHKRQVFGMGGITVRVDQSQSTDNASATLETYHYAVPFTPQFNTVSKIKIKISRIGTPPADLFMSLREDIGGKPIGSVLRTVSKDKNFLNADTLAHWVTFEIAEEVVSNRQYWIVVSLVGTVATDTFRWHHNNSGAAVMRSTNDINWASGGTVGAFVFEEFSGEELVLPKTKNDILSGADKHVHEDTIRKEYITDAPTMSRLLERETENMFKRKEVFSCTVYAPDVLLTSGLKVRIKKQAGGYTFDDDFIIGSVKYTFESSADMSTGTFYYDIEAVRYVEID